MGDVKPLANHLGPLGHPEQGGMDRSVASRNGAALKQMLESEGWAVLQEAIDVRLRHEQKVMMLSRARDDERQNSYEREIGQWAGMKRIDGLVEGLIRYGDQASREMESGEPAATAAS